MSAESFRGNSRTSGMRSYGRRSLGFVVDGRQSKEQMYEGASFLTPAEGFDKSKKGRAEDGGKKPARLSPPSGLRPPPSVLFRHTSASFMGMLTAAFCRHISHA